MIDVAHVYFGEATFSKAGLPMDKAMVGALKEEFDKAKIKSRVSLSGKQIMIVFQAADLPEANKVLWSCNLLETTSPSAPQDEEE